MTPRLYYLHYRAIISPFLDAIAAHTAHSSAFDAWNYGAAFVARAKQRAFRCMGLPRRLAVLFHFTRRHHTLSHAFDLGDMRAGDHAGRSAAVAPGMAHGCGRTFAWNIATRTRLRAALNRHARSRGEQSAVGRGTFCFPPPDTNTVACLRFLFAIPLMPLYDLAVFLPPRYRA